MTEQETREKIKKVLDETIRWEPYYYIFRGIVYEGDLDNIADALIAAGIGDLKEHRIFAGKDGSIKQLYSGKEVEQIAKERDEYKHRAERAERALFTACVNLIKDEEDNVNMELLAHVVYTKFLRKAEKELTEERKDD